MEPLPDLGLEPIKLINLARGLEAGGLYNAAKLFRALAFSQTTRAGYYADIPKSTQDLDLEIAAVLDALRQAGATAGLIEVVEKARLGAADNRTILADEVPAVFVCRNCGHIALAERPATCPVCGARDLTAREFPPIYWLDLYHPDQITRTLEAAVTEIAASVAGLNEEQLARQPAPGEWGVRGVLWHLLVAEGLLYERVKKLLAEEDPTLDALAAWTVDDSDALTTREMLGRWREMRLETVARLREMEPADWWRAGRHDEFGRVTVLQQASYFAIHTLTHLPQLDAILRFLKEGETLPK